MKKNSGSWIGILWLWLQLLLFLNGVHSQQQNNSPPTNLKPQIYWATSVDSSNRRFQQPNEWNTVKYPNDRKWQDSAPPLYNYYPTPSYPLPPPPPPPPAPTTPEPTTTTPEPTTTMPVPPPAPVPAPSYMDQSVYTPAYQAPQPVYYDPRAPNNGYPPSRPYPYHKPNRKPTYLDKYPHKGPTFLDLLEKDKQALDTIKGHNCTKLDQSQKVWLIALVPVVILAIGVPVAAILFSGFTITTNRRSFDGLDVDSVKKTVLDITERYASVLESEECMQRIICSLGSYATNVPGRSYIMTLLSTVAPATMKNNIAIFQKAATYGAEKAQCDNFKCSAWKY